MENKTKFFSKQNMRSVFTGEPAKKAYASIGSILLGLLIGFLIMLCLSPMDAFADFPMLISGGLVYYGSEGLGNIFATMSPLLVCGVAIIFAYKTGIFNIGAAGQYTLGAFGALTFALYFKCHWTVCLLMAIVFGAIWGMIPAILKVFCRVNEVISGIMLNWIGLFFVNYSLQTYLSSIVDPSNSFQTFTVSGISKLPLSDTSLGSNFSVAIIIAIIIAILAFIVMEQTTFGYQLKASGYNRDATKYAGMNAKRNIILTMAISGGLAGLGAGLYFLSGIECWSATISTALPQVPWNGIVVAFVAQMNPIGGIFVAMFLAFLSMGATATSQSVFPKEIADLITSIIVYLSGLTAIFLRFYPYLIDRIKSRKKGQGNNTLSVKSAKEGK